MGATQSNESTVPTTGAQSFSQYLEHIGEANNIATRFADDRGRILKFTSVPDKETKLSVPLFWRHAISIIVQKVNKENKVVARRELSYKQFYKLLHLMRQYGSIEDVDHSISRVKSSGLSDSVFENEANENECAICLERVPDTVLGCTHKFCHICIEQWGNKSQECPMCRQATNKDDSWFIVEPGDTLEEISKFFDSYIQGL